MVAVAQLVESRIVIPVVVGSSPISHPTSLSVKSICAKVAELVDALASGVSAFGCEGSSPSFRTKLNVS